MSQKKESNTIHTVHTVHPGKIYISIMKKVLSFRTNTKHPCTQLPDAESKKIYRKKKKGRLVSSFQFFFIIFALIFRSGLSHPRHILGNRIASATYSSGPRHILTITTDQEKKRRLGEDGDTSARILRIRCCILGSPLEYYVEGTWKHSHSARDMQKKKREQRSYKPLRNILTVPIHFGFSRGENPLLFFFSLMRHDVIIFFLNEVWYFHLCFWSFHLCFWSFIF